MFGINVKPETKEKAKQKLKRVGLTFLDALPWVAAAFTVTAATDAYYTSRRNAKAIQKLAELRDKDVEIWNHNVNVLETQGQYLEVLVDNNKELFNQALETTEGKDSAA